MKQIFATIGICIMLCATLPMTTRAASISSTEGETPLGLKIRWAYSSDQATWFSQAMPAVVGDEVDVVAYYCNEGTEAYKVRYIGVAAPYGFELKEGVPYTFLYEGDDSLLDHTSERQTFLPEEGRTSDYVSSSFVFCDGLEVAPGEIVGFVWQYNIVQAEENPTTEAVEAKLSAALSVESDNQTYGETADMTVIIAPEHFEDYLELTGLRDEERNLIVANEPTSESEEISTVGGTDVVTEEEPPQQNKLVTVAVGGVGLIVFIIMVILIDKSGKPKKSK